MVPPPPFRRFPSYRSIPWMESEAWADSGEARRSRRNRMSGLSSCFVVERRFHRVCAAETEAFPDLSSPPTPPSCSTRRSFSAALPPSRAAARGAVFAARLPRPAARGLSHVAELPQVVFVFARGPPAIASGTHSRRPLLDGLGPRSDRKRRKRSDYFIRRAFAGIALDPRESQLLPTIYNLVLPLPPRRIYYPCAFPRSDLAALAGGRAGLPASKSTAPLRPSSRRIWCAWPTLFCRLQRTRFGGSWEDAATR